MTLSHVVCCVALVTDQQEPQHDADCGGQKLERGSTSGPGQVVKKVITG